MKFAIANNNFRRHTRLACCGKRRAVCRASGFTLAEVLAALLFMAIVIPVAMEALHVASVAGEVGVRKSEAARVADRVLNENIVTTNWTQASLSGTAIENGHEFNWLLKNQLWSPDSSMQLLSAEVTFSAAGKQYVVQLNTLAALPTFGAATTPTGLP